MVENLTNYEIYNMNKKETISYIIVGSIIMFALGTLFYNNISIALVLSCTGIFYPKYMKQNLRVKRKKALKQQFKEAMYSLSSSLSAGRSVEIGIKMVLDDLKILYSESTPIIKEFEILVRKLEMNETVEDVLNDLAKRSNLEEIKNFSNVLTTCKRTGGDLVKIIKYTTSVINEKMEIESNIDVVVTQKKYEYKILLLLVPFIIIYLRIISPSYLDIVYETLFGKIVMTFCLLLYGISYIIGEKITNIEV